MAKKKVAGTPLDSTVPDAKVTIKGQEYDLVFTFAALSIAEKKLKAIGVPANMFHALDFSNVGAQNIEVLLFAALQTHHPDLSFEQVQALITMRNAAAIYSAVANAYMKSMAEPDEAETGNPTLPE